ncbi:MAG: hypothetical protein ACREBN_03640 [Burkholderiaceae bacterium]
MDVAIRYEWALLFGLAIAIGIAELISVRRAIRKARKEEPTSESGPG